MEKIHAAMLAAESFIWIADWQMACDVELASRGTKDYPGRLNNVIRYIISTKKVHIRVLLYQSVKDTIPGTFDGLVAKRINEINKKEYPGSVHVVTQPSTSAQNDAHEYSHHQKFVVVDGSIGFLGGIDLSYGRWETPEFDVVIDPERHTLNDMYNPGQVKLRGMSKVERQKVEKYGFEAPYFDCLVEEGCQPRMPWQDVHVKIEGPSVVDIHRNFVRRWNSRMMQTTDGGPIQRTPDFIDRRWLDKIGGWSRLVKAQTRQCGGAQVQIVRSVSSRHLRQEGDHLEDLLLYPDIHERAAWKALLPAWRSSHQTNIHDAVVECIRSADNYIYIETQFFISQFGRVGEVESSRIGNEDNGIQNTILDELAKRIDAHIRAQPALPFHVYLVIPTHPEGMVSEDAVWKQQWMAIATIKHGSDSLINRIKRSLQARKRDPEEWVQYLTVLNMRSYGATVLYARDPETFDEDFTREIGRYVVTEQIYIHSKLIIVDDAVAILGSANTNDRSLTGNGDTEIAAIVVDTEGVQLRDLGSPTFKVQTRKFARELRRQLWEKHFGFLVDSESSNHSKYFPSTNRALRAKRTVPTPIAHPPRFVTDRAQIEAIGKAPWQQLLDMPCDPLTITAIQKIAAHNANIFEAVFAHTPRNHMKTFDEIATQKFHTLPYPPLYDRVGNDQLWRQELKNNPRAVPFELRRTELGNHEGSTLFDEGRNGTVTGPVGDLSLVAGRNPGGVIPPALKEKFMTKTLLPHQTSALKEQSYFRRQQLYEKGTVHDVTAAIEYLRNNVVGFLVAAPLDWGVAAKIVGDPTKATVVRVDLASLALQDREKGNS